MLFALFYFKHFSQKRKYALLSKAEKDAMEIMVIQLNLCTTTEQTDILEKALKIAGYSPERKRGFIYFPKKNTAIFCKFGFDGVSKTDIVKVFNTIKKDDTAFILSEKFSSDIADFASRFDGRIELISSDKVYKFLSENDCLPQQKFTMHPKSPLKLSALKNLLEKKKAKTHFVLGILFLAISYFVPIKIYYIVFGCIFLIFALICRLFGREKSKNITT